MVDLRGKRPGYDVRYGIVFSEGKGDAVSLRGYDMRIIVKAPAYDSKGRSTCNPRNKTNIISVSNFCTSARLRGPEGPEASPRSDGVSEPAYRSASSPWPVQA